MTDATVDALTALVMIGTWPEAEAELLVRDVIGLDEVPDRLAGLSHVGSGAGGSTIIRP